MSNQDHDLTLLYCRLSREDALEGDSNSIENQKKIVLKAAQDYNFDNLVWLIDDGFTGTNFDRPDFQKGMKLIEEGRVKNFITKDLSRLGRNYLQVGMYTDVIFPKYNVRFIAVQDNYDSNNVESNDMAPIMNLFNEWHPKETSKKVRAVFKAKAERGERVSSQIPYGYARDESTPIGSKKSIKLIIDEETAPVVREIYRLCASGLGPTYIAHILKERKILKPSMYSYEKTGKYGAATDVTDPYGWNDRTVAGILDNEVYIGNTINLKETTVSYKNKHKIQRPEEEWIRVEGTHEAIIDMDTWEIVRRVREGKHRRDSMDGINKYSGLLHCADCEQKLYFVRGKTLKPSAFHFICSRYRKHKGEEQCTPHSIRESVLDEIILEEIRRITYYARTKTKEFAEFINQKTSAESRKELSAKSAELGRLKKRKNELESLFKRLYEDNVLGRITDDQFHMLSGGYTSEQKDVELRIPELEDEIETIKSTTTNTDKFIALAKKYVHIQELTPEILLTFVSKIVIHERSEKRSKSATQQIDIYFTHIGNAGQI